MCNCLFIHFDIIIISDVSHIDIARLVQLLTNIAISTNDIGKGKAQLKTMTKIFLI